MSKQTQANSHLIGLTLSSRDRVKSNPNNNWEFHKTGFGVTRTLIFGGLVGEADGDRIQDTGWRWPN